jgi:hypothetical protein
MNELIQSWMLTADGYWENWGGSRKRAQGIFPCFTSFFCNEHVVVMFCRSGPRSSFRTPACLQNRNAEIKESLHRDSLSFRESNHIQGHNAIDGQHTMTSDRSISLCFDLLRLWFRHWKNAIRDSPDDFSISLFSICANVSHEEMSSFASYAGLKPRRITTKCDTSTFVEVFS